MHHPLNPQLDQTSGRACACPGMILKTADAEITAFCVCGVSWARLDERVTDWPADQLRLSPASGHFSYRPRIALVVSVTFEGGFGKSPYGVSQLLGAMSECVPGPRLRCSVGRCANVRSTLPLRGRWRIRIIGLRCCVVFVPVVG
jgi:hypothetical protein